ncbi:hypothetical protein L2E82_50885 [Cichorium intybus]|nr:hypothetical protein L2E82_50885 [Cichorium intybus]
MAGEGSKWSHISAEKLKKKSNQENNGNHHNKKSVLAKVKEKAKRLKHSFSIKKHRHDNDPPCTSVTRTPIPGSENKRGENVEFHSARKMPESKPIPDTNKQAAISIPTKHSTLSKDEHASSSNTITETQSKNQAPEDRSSVAADPDTKNQITSAVAAESDQKDQVASTADVPKEHDLPVSGISRFSNLTVSTSSTGDRSIEEGEKTQTRDKGVSVKKYLMHKLEPGEDERALSQIITQTISPRRDKVREAMSSFLKSEEPSESTSKISKSENSSDVDNDRNHNFKSKSLPTSVKTQPKIACIEQSHSLGSKACKNLNETFKSTIASYQNNLNSTATSSNRLNSPTKSSSSPLGHATGANETRAPVQTNNGETQVRVSSADQTRVPIRSE